MHNALQLNSHILANGLKHPLIGRGTWFRHLLRMPTGHLPREVFQA